MQDTQSAATAPEPPPRTWAGILGLLFPSIRDGSGYGWEKLKGDLLAGLTVAVVALPQSMAYAVIAGVDPKYGLYAVTIPVILASLCSSSRYLVAGPTNAISMLIFSAMAAITVGGIPAESFSDARKAELILALAVMAGAIQLIMGLARFGSLTHFISHSVIVGFTAGAGVLIAFNQLKNFLGLQFSSSPHFSETMVRTFEHAPQTNLVSLALGAFTILFIIATRKISPRAPGAFLAIAASAVAVFVFDIGESGVRLIGEIPASLPPLGVPALLFDPGTVNDLFMPALAIAILGIIESLSTAKSLANRSGERIDGNREFMGLGVSNIAAGLFSAMPGSGSFTRSALNYSSGARTGLAAAFSGLFVLLMLLVLAPLARYIPIPSLAGLLMVIAWSMIDRHGISFAFRTTRADRMVMLTTLFATLLLDLEKAVFLGVLLSIMLFLRKVSHPQLSKVVPRLGDNHFVPYEPGMAFCPQMAIYMLEGSLFFGAINELEERLYAYDDNHRGKIIIVVIKHVRSVDATGAHALNRFLASCRKEGTRLMFAEPRKNVLETFRCSGLWDALGERNVASTVSRAITLAYENYIDHEECKSCPHRVFFECNPNRICICFEDGGEEKVRS